MWIDRYICGERERERNFVNGLDSNYENWFFEGWREKLVPYVNEKLKNDDCYSEITAKNLIFWDEKLLPNGS